MSSPALLDANLSTKVRSFGRALPFLCFAARGLTFLCVTGMKSSSCSASEVGGGDDMRVGRRGKRPAERNRETSPAFVVVLWAALRRVYRVEFHSTASRWTTMGRTLKFYHTFDDMFRLRVPQHAFNIRPISTSSVTIPSSSRKKRDSRSHALDPINF